MRSPIVVLLLAFGLALVGIGAALLGAQADVGESGSPRSTAVRARTERPPEPPRSAAPLTLPAHRDRTADNAATRPPRIRWRTSVALGLPAAGRLERGVRLPREGAHFFTWDPIERESPNRPWRRWGTDDLVRTTLRVVRDYAAAHPQAPRVGIADLSRPHGGDFGPQFGGIGHASHQNGLDVDVYYPRLDRAERSPLDAGQIDPALSQDLVDRFVAAGAVKVFVGPNTGLTGPPDTVVPLINHDNHLHARISGL